VQYSSTAKNKRQPPIAMHREPSIVTGPREFSIVAAGPELDATVVKNWRLQWNDNGRPDSAIMDDQPEQMMSYIAEARAHLQHQTFAAVCWKSRQVIGTAACQLWAAPMPLAASESSMKTGTVWGVFVNPEHRRQGVATALMSAVAEYWRSIGCTRGVLMCASEEARRIYERMGFGPGNMMLIGPRAHASNALACKRNCHGPSGATTVAPASEELDTVVVQHWRAAWRDAGMHDSELGLSFEESTRAFLLRARHRLELQAYVARENATGRIIGSAVTQLWEGPGSNSHRWQRLIKIGVVWGLYVRPESRHSGVEEQLIAHVNARWEALQCTKGFVYALSDEEASTYRRLGFSAHNAMVIDLGQRPKSPISPMTRSLCADRDRSMKDSETARAAPSALADNCHAPTVEAPASHLPGELPVGDQAPFTSSAVLSAEEAAFVARLRASTELPPDARDVNLAWFRLALPQMLEAALGDSSEAPVLNEAVRACQAAVGTFIDPTSNWFTENIARFGGGFDMKALTAEPGRLARKFDRLADKYDEWTAGNRCSYYHWLARASRAARPGLRAADASIIDVACGIGLPGHMLRLCGFAGRMIGSDISHGMLAQARQRRVYDRLLEADANRGLGLCCASVDLVICMGAMELLDHASVLREFARILRPHGELWASFQWEGAIDENGHAISNPTEHQNVRGVTLPELKAELAAAGFDVETARIERSACAFYTPSPKQDGSLLPVPYLYVTAALRGSD